MDNVMSVADAMALATLRRDWVAAFALADKLLEMKQNPDSKEQEAARIYNERRPPLDGYEVYRWPEFRAFAHRLGLVWDLYTQSVEIRLCEGEVVMIQQRYQGRDAARAAQPLPSPETTTMHNQITRSHMPARGFEGAMVQDDEVPNQPPPEDAE